MKKSKKKDRTYSARDVDRLARNLKYALRQDRALGDQLIYAAVLGVGAIFDVRHGDVLGDWKIPKRPRK